MSILNNAKIKNSETDIEFGFSWIVFSVNGNEYTLQACCNSEGKIDHSDDGMDWGLSLEANQDAFDDFGQDNCVNFFYDNTCADLI